MVYAAGIVLIMIFMPSGIAGPRVDHHHTRFGPEGPLRLMDSTQPTLSFLFQLCTY
jgi:hypothetical protein